MALGSFWNEDGFSDGNDTYHRGLGSANPDFHGGGLFWHCPACFFGQWGRVLASQHLPSPLWQGRGQGKKDSLPD